MSVQNYIFDDSFIADAALSAYRVVVAGQAGDLNGNHVKYPAAQDAGAIIGITQHSTSASGDIVQIRRAGISKVEVASGNITYGVSLRTHDVVGRVDRQTAAWSSGDGCVGQAEEASSASGDIIECWLNVRTLLG